jgi:hypothetical protein
VGVFPNDQALIRLAGSLLIEQNDEWLVSRRYLNEASMAELTPTEQGSTGKGATGRVSRTDGAGCDTNLRDATSETPSYCRSRMNCRNASCPLLV